MKRFFCICAALMLLFGGAGVASADIWDLTTSNSHQYILDGQYSPTYSVYWATRLVAGGYTSTDSSWTTGNEWNSYIDGGVKTAAVVPIGAWTLGSPDFDYGDPNGTYEMFGGAAGMSPKSPYYSDSWFVLGFDQALQNVAGNDLIVTRIGGWNPSATMQVYVSTDTTYSDTMTWILLGSLTSPGSKPTGLYGEAPAQYFDFSSAGITGDVNYVKFVGYGYWIDGVGSTVPVPGAVYLLVSGLLGVFGFRKRLFSGV